MGPAETRPTALLRILFEMTGSSAIVPHRLWLWRRTYRKDAPRDPDLGTLFALAGIVLIALPSLV